tara:strand:- start:1185 stop:1298 length:114 start_codon:yes stop_codon:yes gene_type:complete
MLPDLITLLDAASHYAALVGLLLIPLALLTDDERRTY